jgi:predicted peroxiredoxin
MMGDKKTILYVQTSDAPERQYSPLVLAQTAKAMDINVQVYYLGTGLKILKPGAAEKIKLGSFPSVAEMIKKTLDAGIEIFVCEASKQMLGWEKVDLIPGVKIVGAGTLNDLALEADSTMWF